MTDSKICPLCNKPYSGFSCNCNSDSRFQNIMRGENCATCANSEYIGFDNVVKCKLHMNRTKRNDDRCDDWKYV